MINVNMTDKAGVTLATAGKYCADNVKVTPSAEILRKDEQVKAATPTTSAQDITPDAGKALSKVTVNPITAAIVGNLDASSFAESIVAAVEGKGVTVPDGTLLDGMAALIESIEAGGGGVVLGEITFTSSEDVTLMDAFPVRSQVPKAFFYFEKGLNFNDKTHTKRRPLALIAARLDGGTTIDTVGKYIGAYVQASSGSDSLSGAIIKATNMFNQNSAYASNPQVIMRGNYNTGTLYFGVNSDNYGFIEGRTYVWGVIPWDE